MNIPPDAPINTQKAFTDLWAELRRVTTRMGKLESSGGSSAEIAEVRRDLARIAHSPTFLNSIEISNIHGQPYCIMTKPGGFLHNSSGNWLQLTADAPWEYPWRDDITPSGWFPMNFLNLADATAISAVPNRIGGNPLAQGTGAQQPLFKTNIVNGQGVARFDGVDDNLVGSNLNLYLTDASLGTIFVVARQEAAIADERGLWGSSTAAGTKGNVDAAADNFKAYNLDAGGLDTASKSSAAQGSFHTFIWMHDGVNVYAGVDNADLTALSSAASGARTDGATALLVGKSVTGFWKDDIAELVFVPNVWREETRRRMMYQFNKKFAVTNSGAQPVINPMADIANNRIQILLPGEYHVEAGMGFVSNATGLRGIAVVRNGVYSNTLDSAVFDLRTAITGGSTLGALGRLVRLKSGDYLTLALFQSSGGDLFLPGDLTWMSATWVRP